jgi:hypothetical protein
VKEHLKSASHISKASNLDEAGLDAGFMDTTAYNQTNRWNRKKLARTILDEPSAIQWCQDQNLLPSTKFCSRGHRMELSARHSGFPRFRCRKEECNETVSMACDTWFEDCHLPVDKIIE